MTDNTPPGSHMSVRQAGEYQRWLDREGFGRPQVIAVATRDELEQQNAELRAEIAGLRARIEWLEQG